ncbi:MAG: hypothetical protein K6E76_05300 [Patescibacteria group bacterium]|nr:hypothetical protein [Patescibacteria group bacterium]
MFQTFKTEFAQLLAKIFPLSAQELENEITLAPENVEGDFAFPCFKLSKTLQKTPIEIAKQGIEALSNMESQIFSSFVMVGPYLNAKINV